MPLAPILMVPAFRHGDMTPWGGNKLKTEFGKDAPERTGESMELSVIPGLESRDGQGRTLSELLTLHGKAILGTEVKLPFPLLIKLIDARDQLSVQVHPGDAYAAKKHGKLGKNEAWVILSRDPGAQLIVGLEDGVSLKELEDASRQGQNLDSLLRKVDIAPGETYFIRQGTVHAIRAGIVIYEIQQSSDLTYRLYDWGRVNEDGTKRELHLDDSFAVIDESARPVAENGKILDEGTRGRRVGILDNSYFRLDRLENCQQMTISPQKERFSVITALSPFSLEWPDGKMELKAGQTVLLPADGYPLSLSGKGALWAAPAI